MKTAKIKEIIEPPISTKQAVVLFKVLSRKKYKSEDEQKLNDFLTKRLMMDASIGMITIEEL